MATAQPPTGRACPPERTQKEFRMILWAAFVAIFVGTAALQESRGSLGVFRMPDDLAREIGIDLGASVLHVVPRSPADRAGIVTGDAIIAVNGEKVADFDEMAAKIAER